ncbi:MFS transporter [archaeon]|jgi:MFS family permease|nr:MFS transporter [archaeon]MBT4373904.1 MFS transporter [archaeon]MBT4532181.1 MFS transporter [archaeon]MBT7001134.1 MFS transporter [archaeon]MBT7282023.1 MFS transporter [archaeon]
MKKKLTKEEIKRERSKKTRARRMSIKEGIFATVKSSLADHYISPFAIAINSSNSIVAMLSAIAGLVGPASQMFGSRLIEKYSRKKIILKTIFLESMMLIPFIIIAFLYRYKIFTSILPPILLLTFAIYVIFLNLGSPAWFSWMGDITNDKHRGRYFAKRNLMTGFVSVILAIGAAFFLDFLEARGKIMYGFIILFSIAIIGRLISLKLFKKQYEPEIKLKKGDYFSLTDFLIKAPHNNFGRFTIFRALLGFASAIVSPLVAVYLLRELKFSYSIYMVIIFSATIFSLMLIKLWGKFADKYGNYKTIAIASMFIPVIPLLWVLNKSPIYLIFVPSLVGGVSWAGFNLAAGNFIYDNVSKEKRGVAASYCNVLYGFGIFLGASLGAFLIKILTVTVVSPIIIIFFISAIARMLVVFFSITKIEEVKKTSQFQGHKALKNIIFKQAKPTLLEGAHEIMSIKKYILEK